MWLLQIRWALIPRIYIGGGVQLVQIRQSLSKSEIPYILVQKYMLNHSSVNINKTSKMHWIAQF